MMLEDKTIIKIAYTGAIVFEPDPVAYTYTLETATPAMGSGATPFDPPVPIPGSRLNKISVYADGTLVAYFEVVTADNATSLAGNYVVTDGLKATGQLNCGAYVDISWFGGAGIVESGSYYLDGETKMFIRAGGGNININIADNEGTLTITGDNLPIQDISTGGDFGNLSTPGSVNYPDATREASALPLPNLLSATVTDLAEVTSGAQTGYTVTLKLGEAGVTATQGDYGVTIGGTGKYVSIDFKRDAGTLPSGTYNIKADAEAAVGDAIAGYVLDLGFAQINSGSIWGTATGGAPEEAFILAGGTVTVTESGGTYTITVNATTGEGSVKAVYTGAITIP
ncbi:MAG: hypothetical protein LBG15_13970 [Dysgonamonadaceae bacterium]|nr:hypothetical protein [Dysgonamonadaceae bacterium]